MTAPGLKRTITPSRITPPDVVRTHSYNFRQERDQNYASSRPNATAALTFLRTRSLSPPRRGDAFTCTRSYYTSSASSTAATAAVANEKTFSPTSPSSSSVTSSTSQDSPQMVERRTSWEASLLHQRERGGYVSFPDFDQWTGCLQQQQQQQHQREE